jgi:hypothetical protein
MNRVEVIGFYVALLVIITIVDGSFGELQIISFMRVIVTRIWLRSNEVIYFAVTKFSLFIIEVTLCFDARHAAQMKLTIIGLKSFTSGSLKGKLFAGKKWMSTFDMEKWRMKKNMKSSRLLNEGTQRNLHEKCVVGEQS